MKIDTHTELYGVIGRPLSHSQSPIMHNAAFKACGLNAVYLAFETRDLEGTMRAVRVLNIRGLSVTIPFKSSVVRLLDEVDPLADQIGAVNTILNRTGRLIGMNTDALGGLKALQNHHVSLQDKSCLVLGAGGAARALAWGLKQAGARLALTNRSPERGKRLAADLGCVFIPWEKMQEHQADILVQTTPAGMYPDTEACPVPIDMLGPGMAVMDIIYNPLETRLIKAAAARGCIPITGLEMFIEQGAEQFRLWTGLEAPVEVMRQTVLAALKT